MGNRATKAQFDTNTLVFATSLILLGTSTYFYSGQKSATALIPAVFGAAFMLLRKLASDGGANSSLAYPLSCALALVLGIATTLGGPLRLPAALSGESPNPLAVGAKAITCIFAYAYFFATGGLRALADQRQYRAAADAARKKQG